MTRTNVPVVFLLCFLSFRRVDERGRFSLECYEGFKYLVHAEVRSGRAPMHAEPIETTVGKEKKPVILIINQPGYDRKHKKPR